MNSCRFPNRMTGFLAGALVAAGTAVSAAPFEDLISRSADQPETMFRIADGGQVATIVLSGEDYGPVIRAAKDLSEDVKRVTGTASPIETDGKARPGAILVGTVGKSPLIDNLVKENKLNVDAIRGKWESYLIQVNKDSLVIAGNDKRGTIYGIYELSKRIGVSPWYWWADVPVIHSNTLYAAAGTYVQDPPKVKYRGIFINDEEPSFGNWSRENFGGINSKMYAHMFELILRLKGNYLWPAMWGKAFNEDDPLNPVVADQYGVIMGTSHHEPLMRNQEEWTKRSRELGEWNYRQNGENMRKFWLEGLKRNAKYDNLPTVGLRGDGDLPLDPNANFDSNRDLLHQLFHDQRELIREAYGRDPATVPQMWVVFNEIWTFYNRGVRPPDDVIMAFSDSNFGYLLQLPAEEDRKRPESLGLYYHIDMNGGPWNDRWISTRPIPQIWHQLYIAYQYNIRGMWIVNVGDLKPKEAEIDFILDYAWNPDKIPYYKVGHWMEDWCKTIFPAEHAKACAHLISEYIRLNYIRKPEIQQTRIWSAVNYTEADRFARDWRSLAKYAEDLKKKMPPEYADVFYQLVYYPVAAGAGTAEIYTELAKADQYAKQGRSSAAVALRKAQDLFEKDKQLSDFYNSGKMAGGKWKNMMSDKHIGYTQWSMPQNNSLPRISRMPEPTAEPMLGVAVEGGEKAAPHQVESLTLPTFDMLSKSTFDRSAAGNYEYEVWAVENGGWPVTLFNRSDKGSIACMLKADRPWVKTLEFVTVDGANDVTVFVGIDWSKYPGGKASATLTVTPVSGVIEKKPIGDPVRIAVNAVAPEKDAPKYREDMNEVYATAAPAPIVIPAWDYVNKTGANGANWKEVVGLGRWGNISSYGGAMAVFPLPTPAVLPPDPAPTLEYRVYIPEPGKVTVDVEIMPIYPENPTAGTLNIRELRIGTAFDDGPVKVTDTLAREFKRLNNEVFENVRKVRVTHDVKEAGLHTFKVVMVDPVVAVERLVFYPELVRGSYLGAPFTRAISRNVFADPRPFEPNDENLYEYLYGPDWREKREKRRME